MTWVRDRQRRAFVDRDGYIAAGRNVSGDRPPDYALDVLQAQPHLGVRAVQHDRADLPRIGKQVEHVERDPQVLQRGHVGRGEQRVMRRVIHGGEDVLAELCGRVDNHVVEDRAKHTEEFADQRRRYLFGVSRRGRREQHLEVGLVAGQQRRRTRLVQVAGHRQRVDNGLSWVKLHADRYVSEREVEVRAGRVGGPSQRQCPAGFVLQLRDRGFQRSRGTQVPADGNDQIPCGSFWLAQDGHGYRFPIGRAYGWNWTSALTPEEGVTSAREGTWFSSRWISCSASNWLTATVTSMIVVFEDCVDGL